jgi:hypothetical protein
LPQVLVLYLLNTIRAGIKWGAGWMNT